MRLQQMTWVEVESYLKKSRGVIIPLGSTEQHSPVGLIGTDAICAEVAAAAAGEEAGAVVGPTIAVGMSEHHMSFPGSMTLRPSTLLMVIKEYVLSLARHGFNRIMFVNGHGGNVATAKAAFSEAYVEAAARERYGEDLRCLLVNWYDVQTAQEYSEENFNGREGCHATPSEVSLALAAFPESVKEAGLGEFSPYMGPVYTHRDFRKRYPDGRMGSDPSLASAEHGRKILAGVALDLARTYRDFLEEE